MTTIYYQVDKEGNRITTRVVDTSIDETRQAVNRLHNRRNPRPPDHGMGSQPDWLFNVGGSPYV